MKKVVIGSLAILAMALSLLPHVSQGVVADTSLQIEHLLADGNHDTGGG
ncbi:MAG: hypothetical protein AAF267_06430 [Deinococcota bacterium]